MVEQPYHKIGLPAPALKLQEPEDYDDDDVEVIHTVTKDTTSTGVHPAPAILRPATKVIEAQLMGGTHGIPPKPKVMTDIATPVLQHFEEPVVMRATVHHVSPAVVHHGAKSIDGGMNLAQVSGGDGLTVLTRVVIPSVLALLSTILSYKATNLYFADAAAGGRPLNQALAQTDSDMYDIDY